MFLTDPTLPTFMTQLFFIPQEIPPGKWVTRGRGLQQDTSSSRLLYHGKARGYCCFLFTDTLPESAFYRGKGSFQ